MAHSGTGEAYGKGSLCLFCRSTDGLSPTWLKQALLPCFSHSITAYVCLSLSLHNTHTLSSLFAFTQTSLIVCNFFFFIYLSLSYHVTFFYYFMKILCQVMVIILYTLILFCLQGFAFLRNWQDFIPSCVI